MFSFADKTYMKRALRLAKKGRYTASPNPAVGCVIVKDGIILGEGYHKKAGLGHAEVNALAHASYNVKGSTCYVTLEPCSHYGKTPPCAKALVEAGVARVVIAMLDPNPKVSGNGVKILKEAGIEVEVGLLSDKAYALNRAFFKSITSHYPYVVAKVGMSLDAKTALHSGESKWITGAKSRSCVQKLRAHAGAIITGANTVMADDPSLNVRMDELAHKVRPLVDNEYFTQPIKVILDTRGSLSYKDYKIFKSGRCLHVISDRYRPSESLCANKVPCDDGYIELFTRTVDDVITVLYVPEDETAQISLKFVLNYLNYIHIREVLVEAGASLTTSFLDKKLVNELCVFTASKILGHIARGAFLSKEVESLNNLLSYRIIKLKQIDNDIFVRYSLDGQE